MSGPKISVYSLTGWAKRVVEGQIRCERRSLHCAEQIRSLLAECSGMGSELDKALATLELWQRRCGGEEKQIEEIRTLQRSMDQEIQKIRREYDRNIPRISSKYVISEEALKQKKRELEKLNGIRNKAQVLRDRLDQAAGTGRRRSTRRSPVILRREPISLPEADPMRLPGRVPVHLQGKAPEHLSETDPVRLPGTVPEHLSETDPARLPGTVPVCLPGKIFPAFPRISAVYYPSISQMCRKKIPA